MSLLRSFVFDQFCVSPPEIIAVCCSVPGSLLHRVFNRHSWKCVTLLKLRTELKTNFSLLGPIFLENFLRALSCHKSYTVRAFDLILMLRARSEYQLWAGIPSHKAGTKLPHKLALYVVWPRFSFYLTTCRGEPLSTNVKVVTALML